MSNETDKKIDALVENFKASCRQAIVENRMESTAKRVVRKSLDYAANQHEAVADGVEGAVSAAERFFDWALK